MKSNCSTALKRAALVLPLLTGPAAYAADQPAIDKPIQLAQAQPQEDPAARKRREEEQKRRQQPPAQQQQQQQQQPQQRRPEGQQPRAQRPEGQPPGQQGNQRSQRQFGNQQQQQKQDNQQPPGGQPGNQRGQRPLGNQSPQQQQSQQPAGNNTPQQNTPVRPRTPSTIQGQPNQPPGQGTPPGGQPAIKRGQPSILNPNASTNQPAPSTRTTTPVVPTNPTNPTSQQQQTPLQTPRSVEGQRVIPPGGGTIQQGNRGGAPVLPTTQNPPPTIQGLPRPLPTSQRATIAPQRFDQVQQKRETRVEAGGKRTVISEGNNRVIIKQDNRVFIRHDDAERFKRIQNARSIPLANGGSQTFYVRPDGFRVVTETDRNGGLIRRYRRGPDGREYSIIDNRRFWRNAAIGVGVGVIAAAVIVNLRSPTVTIPRERYIVDYHRADDEVLYEALSAPPIERPQRVYSLEEVRYNYPLREHMRSVDLDDITFEFGAFEVTPDQFNKLERLAKMINRVIEKNADEVFMIEGHTDAVGSDVDNLSLSDRRAQSVAQILSEQFGIPPENLVTQGYGEQFLKVKTQEAERTNRRVTVRRITPLIAEKGLTRPASKKKRDGHIGRPFFVAQ